jgi:hypothetical protein
MKNKALEMALARADFWKKMAKALVGEPQIQIKKTYIFECKNRAKYLQEKKEKPCMC